MHLADNSNIVIFMRYCPPHAETRPYPSPPPGWEATEPTVLSHRVLHRPGEVAVDGPAAVVQPDVGRGDRLVVGHR